MVLVAGRGVALATARIQWQTAQCDASIGACSVVSCVACRGARSASSQNESSFQARWTPATTGTARTPKKAASVSQPPRRRNRAGIPLLTVEGHGGFVNLSGLSGLRGVVAFLGVQSGP